MGMLFRYHTDNANNNNTAKGAAKEVAPEPEKKTENGPTASDIRGMSGVKLRKIAKDYGIEDPDDLTVGEIKSILIEKLS